MTHEQDWAFYKLIPKLLELGFIVEGFEIVDGIEVSYSEAEIGQAILDIAAEDGVIIDADAACEACRLEDSGEGRGQEEVSALPGALAPRPSNRRR